VIHLFLEFLGRWGWCWIIWSCTPPSSWQLAPSPPSTSLRSASLLAPGFLHLDAWPAPLDAWHAPLGVLALLLLDVGTATLGVLALLLMALNDHVNWGGDFWLCLGLNWPSPCWMVMAWACCCGFGADACLQSKQSTALFYLYRLSTHGRVDNTQAMHAWVSCVLTCWHCRALDLLGCEYVGDKHDLVMYITNTEFNFNCHLVFLFVFYFCVCR
jgi:hypothetical protein